MTNDVLEDNLRFRLSQPRHPLDDPQGASDAEWQSTLTCAEAGDLDAVRIVCKAWGASVTEMGEVMGQVAYLDLAGDDKDLFDRFCERRRRAIADRQRWVEVLLPHAKDWRERANLRFSHFFERGFMYFAVSDGWGELVTRLFERIDALPELVRGPAMVITDVKSKYGGLRCYNTGPDEVEALVQEAENESEKTCEVCGAPGQMYGGGWIVTLCDPHARDQGLYVTTAEAP